jgi:CelD/BcsL family acetyltransferase involved in cellulose biosynthesis
MMRRHDDWSTSGFDLRPVAPSVGPFAGRSFLATLWRHRATNDDALWIVEQEDALVVLCHHGDVVRMAGDSHLVDYRTPLGATVSDLIADVVTDLPSGTAIRFDSLPIEAAEPIVKGMAAVGIPVVPLQHTTAAVLHLPESFDEYLQAIGKKERHEMRRKRRRFREHLGFVELIRVGRSGDVFDQFIDLHRRSAGAKGSFMTDDMAGLFEDLLSLPGWEIDALVYGGGVVAAAAFGFVGEDGYYLYNSAYDPDLHHVSPGVVMLGALIERAIDEGKAVFDFLKGDEAYKFRLGAVERPLYAIEAVS